MVIARTLFGRIKSVTCDRCDDVSKPYHSWKAFCAKCYLVNPDTIRGEDVCDSGFSTNSGSENIRCSLCEKPGRPEEFYHVCIKCYARHPDSTHSGFWAYAPLGVGNIEVEDCYSCGCICIRDRVSERETKRIYYKVGQKKQIRESFKCLGNLEELRAKQKTCKHDYIKVFSNVRPDAEAMRLEASLREQPIAMLMMASDMAGLEHNLAYASEGSTHFWCWKCGFYRNLNPSRYGLLPSKGEGKTD